jgi:site-specific recombinase XerD
LPSCSTPGIIEWTVRIRSPRVTAYRDTRGPGLEAVQALFDAADGQPGLLGLRDAALVRALFVLGLRRGEVTSLRLCDWDATQSTLAIVGKGRRDRELISVAPELAHRIEVYVAARAEAAPAQPLFVTHGPCSRDRRLEGDAIRRALSRLSRIAVT